MGIKEILEAKRAAAMEATGSSPMTVEAGGPVIQTIVVEDNTKKPPLVGINTEQKAIDQVTVGTPAEIRKILETVDGNAKLQSYSPVRPPYPTADANGKPLSGFAAIQARKRIDAAFAITEAAYKERIASIPADVFSAQNLEADIEEEILNIPIEKTMGKKEVAAQEVASQEEQPKASPETEQAYFDLKQRIDALVALSDDNLRMAMSELKKALMQNPNAVSLMLPSDIGQMVIALRKMTGVELAKINADKKTGTVKSKQPILTAEDMEKAFQDL